MTTTRTHPPTRCSHWASAPTSPPPARITDACGLFWWIATRPHRQGRRAGPLLPALARTSSTCSRALQLRLHGLQAVRRRPRRRWRGLELDRRRQGRLAARRRRCDQGAPGVRLHRHRQPRLDPGHRHRPGDRRVRRAELREHRRRPSTTRTTRAGPSSRPRPTPGGTRSAASPTSRSTRTTRRARTCRRAARARS